MRFYAESTTATKHNTDCLIIACDKTKNLIGTGPALDKACKGHIKKVLSQGDFKGKVAETLLLYPPIGIKASRILLIGIGKEGNYFSPNNYQFYENCCFFSVFHFAAAMLLHIAGGKGKHDLIRAFRNYCKRTERTYAWCEHQGYRIFQ